MPHERRLTGLSASPGLAIGELWLLADAEDRQAANPAAPHTQADLETALASAKSQLAGLMDEVDELGAEILEFQVALLEDDDLLAPIFQKIAEGDDALTAWRDVMNSEIADYAAVDDAYMAARAADLKDLRDRVANRLADVQSADIQLPNNAIIWADDLPPSRFLELARQPLGGVVLKSGSTTSHVAILARARGIPMAVGLPPVDAASAHAVLDAGEGLLIIDPDPATLTHYRTELAGAAARAAAANRAALQPAQTADGEPVELLINVDEPSMLQSIDPLICDGIGLVRTEFLAHDGVLPSEEAQAAAYRALLSWAGNRPVTIRTLDAGGDKPIAGYTVAGEENPFLGERGIRLSLKHQTVFQTQLRALCRAAIDVGAMDRLKIMLPMVTVPAELVQARQLLDEVLEELTAASKPQLGIMIETPASAIMPEEFDASFFSIGSNDLIQYVTACARESQALRALASPQNPAVLALIARVIAVARQRSIPVSLCGDMASDPACVPLLLTAGLRTFSVAPAQAGRIKQAIAQFSST